MQTLSTRVKTSRIIQTRTLGEFEGSINAFCLKCGKSHNPWNLNVAFTKSLSHECGE